MGSERFTKGEWVVEKHEPFSEWSIEANHDDEGFFDMICDEVSIEADAHLIAAAPEMYRILSELDVYDGSTGSVNLQKKIDDVLAKARG